MSFSHNPLFCDHLLENLKSVSTTTIKDSQESVWVGWFTPAGTRDTCMVGLTSIADDKPHYMTDDECRYIQAEADYNSKGYAIVWEEMIR